MALIREDQYFIFTDGACSGNPGPGGWASICYFGDKVFEIGGAKNQTTNNEMELLAAIEALKKAPQNKQSIYFFADSVYVLRGASQWIHGWSRRNWLTAEGKPVLNQNLWQELQRLLQTDGLGKRIKWQYVRGHQGIAGNERCDELAVLFSKGERPRLLNDLPNAYPHEIWQIPDNTEIPEMKTQSSAEKKAPMGYLSSVGSVVCLHANWDSCQRATTGQPRARFKKVMNQNEMEEVLKLWGVNANQVKDLRSKS